MTQEKLQRIFLLSHMRAYSSLIGHIMGSHPEINSYYEMHLSYLEAAALKQQLTRYCQSEDLKPESHYLFDKLLHNEFELDLGLFPHRLPCLLVALRRPLNTIKSILHLFRNKAMPHPYARAEQAAGYYIERLAFLADFCSCHAGRYFYFDSELVRTDSAVLLRHLQDWCQLSSPLSTRYRRFSKTGLAGAGDSSRLIQQGRVIRSETDYAEIQVDSGLMEAAEQAYHRYRAVMVQHARQSLRLEASVK